MLAFVNMVGGQDELVFDGGSLIVNERGELVARGRAVRRGLLVADLDLDAVFHARLHDPRRRKEKLGAARRARRASCSPAPSRRRPAPPRHAGDARSRWRRVDEVYQALVLGTRDYVRKNGFKHVVIGLSGGIDSALVAAVAVDALGAENVSASRCRRPTRRGQRERRRGAGQEPRHRVP